MENTIAEDDEDNEYDEEDESGDYVNQRTEEEIELEVERLKLLGNEEFARGRHTSALKFYTEALDTSSVGGAGSSVLNTRRAQVFANRSLIHAKLGLLELSASDGYQCLRLARSWPKGYLRLGQALLLLRRSEEALMSFELGLSFLQSGEDDEEAVSRLEKDFKDKIVLAKSQLISDKPAAGMAAVSSAEDIAITLSGGQSTGSGGVENIYIQHISSGGEGRGVFARQSLGAGVLVLTVPRSLLITLSLPLQPHHGSPLLQNDLCRRLMLSFIPPSFSPFPTPSLSPSDSPPLHLTSPKHSFLAVFMLCDRINTSSVFQPYYKTLPQPHEVRGIPLFWSPGQQEALLRGSCMLDMLRDRESDYNEIVRSVPEFQKMASYDSFVYMRMIVNSRNFQVDMDGVKTLVMAPLIDMLNHRREPPPQTRWHFDQQLQAFALTCTSPVLKGEQLYDSYGTKSNARYLLNYGFTVENNRDADGTCYDEIKFEVDLDPSDISYSKKRAMLERSAAGCSVDTSRVLHMSQHLRASCSRKAFSFARFVFATAEELLALPPGTRLPSSDSDYDRVSAQEDEEEGAVRPLSARNEKCVLQMFKEKGLARLAMFESSLQDDCEVRPTLIPHSSAWNACNLRIGEKEVCHHLIDLCDECCYVLSLSLDVAERYISKRRSSQLSTYDAQRAGVMIVSEEITEYLLQVVKELLCTFIIIHASHSS